VRNRFKNSTPAFVLTAITCVVFGTLGGIYFPELAEHALKASLGHAVSLACVGLAGWAGWLFVEQKKYGGWQIQVLNLDRTTDRDSVPPPVVKRWILSEFSGFGPNGWRDIVATLDIRDNGCPTIKCDAWQAKKRGVLIVDYTRKVVHVNYLAMKEHCQEQETSQEQEPGSVVQSTAVVNDEPAISGQNVENGAK